MGHGAGDNPQAIVEHSPVVHYHEFYFTFLLPVNETLLPPDVQSLSLGGITELLAHIEAWLSVCI